MEKIGPPQSSQYHREPDTLSEASKNYGHALGKLTECLGPARSASVKQVIWHATNVKAWARSLKAGLRQLGYQSDADKLEREAQGELNYAKAKAGGIDHPAFDLSSDLVGEDQVWGAQVDYTVAKTRVSYCLASGNREEREQLKEAAIQLAISVRALEDMYIRQATPESLSLCQGVDKDACWWLEQCEETTGVPFRLQDLLTEASAGPMI